MKKLILSSLFLFSATVFGQNLTYSTANAKSLSLQLVNPFLDQAHANPLGLSFRKFSKTGLTAQRYRILLNRDYTSVEINNANRFNQERSSEVLLSYGVEKRYSQSRVQAYNAIDFGYSRYGTSSRTFQNVASADNDWTCQVLQGVFSRLAFGADVFLFDNLSIGTEYSFDLRIMRTDDDLSFLIGGDVVSNSYGKILLTYYF